MATARRRQRTGEPREGPLCAGACARVKAWPPSGAGEPGGRTDLLAPLLPAAVGDDGRVDEGAFGGHALAQQALHFLRPEAGGEVQQLHVPAFKRSRNASLPCWLGSAGTPYRRLRQSSRPPADTPRGETAPGLRGSAVAGPSQAGRWLRSCVCHGQAGPAPDSAPGLWSPVSPSSCWEGSSGPTPVPSLAASLLPASTPTADRRAALIALPRPAAKSPAPLLYCRE